MKGKRNVLKSEHIFLLLVFALFLYINTRHNRSLDSTRKPEKHVTFNDDRDVLIYNQDTVDQDIPSEPRRYYDSKYYPRKAMRINVPTRGEPPSYQQVGLLQDSTDSENVKPLYGRQTYPGSNQWNYFTSTDSHLATKIPLEMNSQDCTDERGCKELQKNENVNVLDKDYKVNIYGTIAPRYIPY
jgi:hypothetical protein